MATNEHITRQMIATLPMSLVEYIKLSWG
jgi:hypothetical protein